MTANCSDPNCSTCKLTARIVEVLKDGEDFAEGMTALTNAMALHVWPRVASGEFSGPKLVRMMSQLVAADLITMMENNQRGKH